MRRLLNGIGECKPHTAVKQPVNSIHGKPAGAMYRKSIITPVPRRWYQPPRIRPDRPTPVIASAPRLYALHDVHFGPNTTATAAITLDADAAP